MAFQYILWMFEWPRARGSTLRTVDVLASSILARNLLLRYALSASNPSSTTHRHWICLVSLLWLIPTVSWAQSSPNNLVRSSYTHTDFTVDDGLPDNVVNAITQTQNGLLWIGSGDHLASFDGRTFTPIQLRIPGVRSPGSVNALTEGIDGSLWVGTSAGIVRIPKEDLVDSATSESTSFRLGKLGSATVLVLFVSQDGTVWAGASDGLYRFDGNQFRCVESSESVSRIIQASDGRLILITSNGVVEYDGKSSVRRSELGAEIGVRNDQIFDAYQDSQGNMWYGTAEGIRTNVNQRIRSFNPGVPAHMRIYRFFRGRSGVVWASTPNAIYAIAGQTMWTPAPNLEPRSFCEDKDGDLWIGTNGGGLVHLHPRIVEMYTKTDGLPSDIAMAVLPAQDGRLWIGMNCGLAVLEGKKFRIFNGMDGLANTCVWSLAEDHDHSIWIGTYGGGLFRYRSGRFAQYSTKEGLGSNIVGKIAVARDNSLWVATSNGLSHLQDGKIRNYTAAEGLASSSVLDVYQDKNGTVWVATHAGVDMFASGGFVHLPAANEISDLLPRRFFEDTKGHLYAEDEPEGISRISNGTLTEFNSSLNVMQMQETPDQRIWFSSTKGLIEISEDNFLRAGHSVDPLDYEIFNRADGLPTNELSSGDPDIALTPDGKLWIATVEGLAVIDTSHLPLAGKRSPVFVAGASIDGKSHLVDSRLVLQPGVHRVELQLAAVDLGNPQRIRLQYRMEGVDSEWLNANSSRVAVYTSFPVGTHQMLVRATDSTGRWSMPTVVYEVTQLPHFFETWIFRIGAVVAFLLLLFLLYLWRVRYLIRQSRIILEERQVERETVARDLHDTFLQSVQGLILHFHTGTQELPEDHPIRQSFEDALRQSDAVSREGRDVLSRLHLSTTKPESLRGAFAALGKEFRRLSPAQFDVIASGNSRDLNAVVQSELVKIGREAIFNSFRHAKANRIEVELRFGLVELRIRFRDDGIGIDPSVLRDGNAAGHYGLPGMRERCSKIRSTLELWSRPGAGTEVEIRVPAAIAYPQTGNSWTSRWASRLFRRRTL
jgi:ligand-binding sensor domain-containing protein/signal transduction histidine kinase